jgi:hypothetical protein
MTAVVYILENSVSLFAVIKRRLGLPLNQRKTCGNSYVKLAQQIVSRIHDDLA